MLFIGLFYSVSLIACGLSRDPRLHYGGPLALLLVAPLVGYTSWEFSSFGFGYLLLTAWMVWQPLPPWLRNLRYLCWFFASAVLLLHAVPGDSGLLLLEQETLKSGSVATNLYLNHDKVWVAWSLLSWLPLVRLSMALRRPFPRWLAPVLLAAGVAAVMALAAAMGLVHWQPALTPWFWTFAVINLVNTCVAEELLFRGLLQRQLAIRFGWITALVVASGAFGLAHLAGGWKYVAVACLAGLVYGLAYLWTGRLVWAVLVHWGLNLSHLLLFTYPLSK
ncbi:CPBP family intramembrane glutamic endopeptidase [Marinobacter sp. SS21]|uniref:CPBP family intramembrane glutamic endopeptidase n=1 Tax=Marinobacter sp. SS21 TaxID=2979460 RepID=UPI00232C6E8C|nr:CPBP family intramembrane glutamic endopeptidase [Marinobacter sp. SS21]MDC0663653.1 CPBP family intramembrane metalloprotease [Marinobacter sp. SS21]